VKKESTSYIRQLGSDTLVYGIAGTINRFLNILLIPVYTRFFSPSDYGALAITLSFHTLLTLILTSLDNAAARWFFDSDDLIYRKQVIASWFWFQILLGSVLLLFVALLAGPLAKYLFNSVSHINLILLAGLFAFFSIFGKVLSNWLRFLRKPWMMLQYSLFSSVGTIGIIIIFVAVCNYGVVGTFSAQVLAGIVIALVTVFILRTWVDPRRCSSSNFKEMLTFSLPVFPATLASWITTASDRSIMPFFMNSGEIGIYFLSFQVASIIGVFDAAFQMAWGPFAMSLIGNPDSKSIYSRVLSVYVFLGCWFCLVLSLMAPVILPIIATPEYNRAASCIPMLAFFFLAIGLGNVIGIGTTIVKDSRPIAINIYIGAGISTVILFALMPIMGKEGAAIAKMIGMLVAVGYIYFASQRRFFIPYKIRDMVFSFVFAWLLIGISQWLPLGGWTAFFIRSTLCLLFIPLGFWLSIIKPHHVSQSIVFFKRKMANLSI
jgi:O-antigen/teichoic acid export membrane protein